MSRIRTTHSNAFDHSADLGRAVAIAILDATISAMFDEFSSILAS